MRRGRAPGVALVLLALVLAACETPYQPRAWNGGYTDFEAQPGVHYVGFEARRGTGYPAARRYWHRRAAEVCGGADRYTRIWTFERPDALRAPSESDSEASPPTPSGEPTQQDVSGMLLVEGYIVCTQPFD